MSIDWRQRNITPYTRQLKPAEIPPGLRFCVGPNDIDKWLITDPAFDVETFPAYHNALELSGGIGMYLSAGATNVEYDLPLVATKRLELKISDYDQALIDTFIRWKSERTDMRVFKWGVFVAVGRVAIVPIEAPYGREFSVTLFLRGLRMFKPGSSSTQVTQLGGNQGPICNTPFYQILADQVAMTGASYLYGNEFAQEGV